MTLRQVAQHADDLDRAERFYSALLGQGPVARFDPPGLVFYLLGQTRLLLDRAAPSALLYFTVDGIQDVVDSLRARGSRIVTEPHVIFTHSDSSLGPIGTDEWQAFVEDSEGNTIGLIQTVAPPRGRAETGIRPTGPVISRHAAYRSCNRSCTSGGWFYVIRSENVAGRHVFGQ